MTRALRRGLLGGQVAVVKDNVWVHQEAEKGAGWAPRFEIQALRIFRIHRFMEVFKKLKQGDKSPT